MRIGIVGHRRLPPSTEAAVERKIRLLLRHRQSFIGISCLADGADQIFAQAVLDLEGDLWVVVPAQEYRQALPAEAQTSYDRLFESAAEIVRLPYITSTEDAHLAAGKRVVELSEEIFAVWDGEPARGRGGTEEIVSWARSIGVPTTVIWPEGASRD